VPISGKPIHALERLQHAAGVGAHQALVVEAEIRGDGTGVHIKHVIGAVVQAEGVAGVEDAGAVVEGEDGVGPVQIGRAQEFKAVLHAALRVGAQIQLLAALHRPALEGPVHLVGQVGDRHLGGHDLDLRVERKQVADQAGVVGLGVAHDQVIDRLRVDLLLQQRQPGALKLEVAGVDQGGALTPHQEAVVGGAVAQAELNVEAAAVPVERADRGAVGPDRRALQAQAGGAAHGGIHAHGGAPRQL
jgi:hypothetical protein